MSQSSAPQPPPVPGGAGANATGASGTPDGGGKKPKRRVLVIVIAVVVVLIAAAVGGFLYWKHTQNTAQQASPEQSETQPKKDSGAATPKKKTETKPTKPKVSEVSMTDFRCGSDGTRDKWDWSGGALVSAMVSCADDGYATDGETSSNGSQSGDEGEYSFGLWTPALEKSKVIHVSMLKSGEKEEAAPTVAATYGDDPAVFVIYAVKTKAVGTTPETVHLYAHEVNVEKGTLGKRIDLKTEEDNLIDRDQDYRYAVIGQSDTRVAVQKTWRTTEKFTVNDGESSRDIDHAQIMALTRGKSEATTLQTFQDKGEVVSDSGGYQSIDMTEFEVDGIGVYDTYAVAEQGPKSKTYHLYAIDGDKKLVDVPDTYCGSEYGCGVDRIRRVGDDHWLFDDWMVDATGAATSVASIVGVDEDAGLDLDQFADGTVYVQSNYDQDGNNAKRVFLIDDDLKATEVLDKDRWNRLLLSDGGFEGINYLTGEIYVKTTDEQITVNRKGKAVGSYDELPYAADDDSPDHTHMTWMLFRQSDDNGDVYTVTLGQEPGQPAPDDAEDAE